MIKKILTPCLILALFSCRNHQGAHGVVEDQHLDGRNSNKADTSLPAQRKANSQQLMEEKKLYQNQRNDLMSSKSSLVNFKVQLLNANKTLAELISTTQFDKDSLHRMIRYQRSIIDKINYQIDSCSRVIGLIKSGSDTNIQLDSLLLDTL